MSASSEMSLLLRYMNLPADLSEALSFDEIFNDPTIKQMVDRYPSVLFDENVAIVDLSC